MNFTTDFAVPVVFVCILATFVFGSVVPLLVAAAVLFSLFTWANR